MGLFSRFRSSLTYPIIGTLVLVTVVPAVVVGWLLAASNRDHLTTMEKQYLTRQAVSLANEVSLFFERHRSQLQSTAHALGAGRPLAEEAYAGLVAQVAGQDSAFLEIQASDTRGAGGFARNRDLPEVAGRELAHLAGTVRERVLEGETVEELHVPVPGLPSGVAVYGFPLRSGEGRTWGALLGILSLEPLERRLRDRALAGLLVTVVDSGGYPVLASRPGLSGDSPVASPLVREFLRTPLRLTRIYRRTAGETPTEVLGSIVPVEQPPWGVLVERPTAEAFATVRAMQTRTILASLVAAAVALGLGVLVSRRLIHPLQALAAVTSELAEGNLAVRAEVSGDNELARLAENFNHMAGNIEGLVRKLRQALRQNQELFLETIRTLAAAIDAKDPYTRGHSERVSSYSMAIAKHLGLSSEEVFRIRTAAILHDVGKLGIRDEILLKPGGLSEEEYSIMRRHPEIGAQIMAPIRMLRDIIPGIRNHHETWDGTGYPDGLRGEEIPLVARIIGVADTFDAMTTNRPYQKAMSLEYVMARLRTMAGSRFDPRVIDALSKAVAAGDITPPVQETQLQQEAT